MTEGYESCTCALGRRLMILCVGFIVFFSLETTIVLREFRVRTTKNYSKKTRSLANDCQGQDPRVLELLRVAKKSAADADECRVTRLLPPKGSYQHEYGITTCEIIDMCRQLPKWKQIVYLYGEKPVVLGEETYPPTNSSERHLPLQNSTIHLAGLYNAGTNAVKLALMDQFPDLVIDDDEKHSPASVYLNNTSSNHNHYSLTIVVVRDPFRWMASMCKTNYDATWIRVFRHCPNLVPNPQDWQGPLHRSQTMLSKLKTYSVAVDRYNSHYESLADMWTQWHLEYWNRRSSKKTPTLFVRYEDFVFHREAVMSEIAKRVHGTTIVTTETTTTTTVKYRMNSAKMHGSSTNFVAAVIQYGTPRGRYHGMSTEDLRYAAKALDPQLLRMFHYLAVPKA